MLTLLPTDARCTPCIPNAMHRHKGLKTMNMGGPLGERRSLPLGVLLWVGSRSRSMLGR